MTTPGPRKAADDVEDRALFLRACAQIWETAREASKAEMVHGAHMILHKLGGTLVVRAESRILKRTVPEVIYQSDGFTELGGRLLG